MTTNQGILTILHPVSDLSAATPIYTALLGTQPSVASDYYVGYDVGGQHVGLLPGGGPQRLTAPTAYWQVDDIHAAVAALTAAGASARDEVQDVGGGRLVATVVDGDGNVIGVARDS